MTQAQAAAKRIHFTKMQGLGNDFMVLDNTQQTLVFDAKQIQAWSNRYTGIGFDQLLVVETPSADLPLTTTNNEPVAFRYRIFNADGSEVQQCGNGARCFARFVFDKGLTQAHKIPVQTASGVIVLYIEDHAMVRVNMGQPNFSPKALPFNVTDAVNCDKTTYSLSLTDYAGESHTVSFGVVSMGNPHMVIPVADINTAPVAQLGPVLESHACFPERVNVGFAQCISRTQLHLRVYERGAAETLACGTGACAAMAVYKHWGLVDDQVTVSLPGGDLSIHWNGEQDAPLWMSGPALTVFEGEVVL